METTTPEQNNFQALLQILHWEDAPIHGKGAKVWHNHDFYGKVEITPNLIDFTVTNLDLKETINMKWARTGEPDQSEITLIEIEGPEEIKSLGEETILQVTSNILLLLGEESVVKVEIDSTSKNTN